MVKLNDFQRVWGDVGASVLEAVEAVGQSGWYILGAEVEAFENDLAAFWKQREAVGVASGLDAIEIGLRCCGCRAGDKVLVPPVSAFATVLAVIKLGAVPVFVDCDRFGLMDLDQAAQALKADPAIRFMVPVHLYGHCLDLGRLRQLGEEFGVHILEDCAQAIGATHRGVPCGSVGECAATSFYPTKNLGAFGDGGALLTSQASIAGQARCLRDYGQSRKYHHQDLGYNSRLDELQAAILRRVLLPRLPAWTETRRAIADQYLAEISNPLTEPLGLPEGSESCWHLFPVRTPVGRKQELIAHLRARGIQSAEHYPTTMLEQPALHRAPHERFSECPTGTDLCAREVSLPIHPYLERAEAARVIEACNSWK